MPDNPRVTETKARIAALEYFTEMINNPTTWNTAKTAAAEAVLRNTPSFLSPQTRAQTAPTPAKEHDDRYL